MKLDAFVIPDFICYGKIVLELKAEPRIVSAHEGQVLCYLTLTGHKLGIIANFGHYPLLEHKRLAH
ncbi:MAG: GxxExxY protein [Gemmataceae bacterium]|nr:GxxExxY protein [Gemmataceae bacterium]